jgi:hypothetical protein
MRRTEALRVCEWIKFRSVFERCEASELNQIDAAALLGVSERTSAGGACALKTAARPAYWTVVWARHRTGGYRPAERQQQIETLYRTRPSGFTAKHFHEHLVREHTFRWGYTWPKVCLQSRGLLPPAKTRAAHRRKRDLLGLSGARGPRRFRRCWRCSAGTACR